MTQNSTESASGRPVPTEEAQNPRLDRLDERILWELSRDADVTNASLAERLHVSPSTTLARTKALRAAGVLRSSHAGIDYGAVGLPLQAVVSVRLRVQARAEVKNWADKIIRLPNVINIFFLGGQVDFMVHVATTSPTQLRDFVTDSLSTDAAVASTETQIVFDWRRGEEHRAPGGTFEQLRAPMR
jgi:DNA-binding Lrp family transcriptional regulator